MCIVIVSGAYEYASTGWVLFPIHIHAGRAVTLGGITKGNGASVGQDQPRLANARTRLFIGMLAVVTTPGTLLQGCTDIGTEKNAAC